MKSAFAIALLAASLLTSAPGSLRAHEGHDHGEQAATPQPTHVATRAEASSTAFELVAVARGGELVVYLDRFDTNEPIEGAVIEVETPAGPATATAHAGGAYRIDAPWLTTQGRFDLLFTVTSGKTAEIMPLVLEISPPVTAPPPPSTSWSVGTAFAQNTTRLVTEDGAFLIGGLGFALGVLATLLLRRRRTAAPAIIVLALLITAPHGFAHEGHDHGEPAKSSAAAATGEYAQRLPDGAIFMPKPVQRIFAVRTIMTEIVTHRRSVELPGRIIPDPDASGYVQAAIGGRLVPPKGGFARLGTEVKAGDVLAYLTPPMQAIDVSDLRQKQGELDQQISIVQKRLARFEQLVPGGSVPRAQLEEARIELQGLKERRGALDKVQQQPEALVAPVRGVVADGNPISGQIAQPNTVIFHIVDPSRLWVEALSFEALGGTPTASANTGNGKSLTLAYRGSGFADRSQSVPIHFSIQGDTAGLRAGQFVTVLAVTDEETRGIAVPRSSLVRNANGQDFIYEHVAPERFEPRQVRVEPLDGTRVLVSAGVSVGKRIVSQGAELLGHVR